MEPALGALQLHDGGVDGHAQVRAGVLIHAGNRRGHRVGKEKEAGHRFAIDIVGDEVVKLPVAR